MEDCGLELPTPRISRLPTPWISQFGGRSGMSTNNCAERTPRELRGHMLRLFQGPCSSTFERLTRFCIFRMA
eukprot:5727269-Alexandrium_andersonii.AAC.1